MIAYLCYSLLLSGWVYPIIVHAIWSSRGFLSATAVDPLWGVGMIDFAGSGVVHLTGGTTAFFAALILGARRGRFHDESGRCLEVPKDFPGSSFSLQVRIYLSYIHSYISTLYSPNADLDCGPSLHGHNRCWGQSFFGTFIVGSRQFRSQVMLLNIAFHYC
jgi:Ammonium Transporter Family